MNLYQVMPDYEYTYFVFAETRNRAKAACVHYSTDYGEEYTDMRCKLLAKDIPNFPVDDLRHVVIVDSEDDVAYAIVKELGFRYSDDETDY